MGRELAAHELTSGWVHDGTGEICPLLLHWRVVAQRCQTDTSEIEAPGAARRWGQDWPRVRDRLDALCEAESSVVLFLEHVPETLGTWLRQKLAADARTAGDACTEALDQIITATAWMRAHGLQHLDIHPQNILMSEGQLLFTDFGLSMHESFELDDDERAFFSRHENYDHDAGVTSLLHWTLVELGIGPRADRLALLRAAAVDSDDPPPPISFEGKRFCFTGTFNYGTRKICERAVLERGGAVGNVSKKTDFLVVGSYATDSWKHSSFGTKIIKACELRDGGAGLAIVSELHWVQHL